MLLAPMSIGFLNILVWTRADGLSARGYHFWKQARRIWYQTKVEGISKYFTSLTGTFANCKSPVAVWTSAFEGTAIVLGLIVEHSADPFRSCHG